MARSTPHLCEAGPADDIPPSREKAPWGGLSRRSKLALVCPVAAALLQDALPQQALLATTPPPAHLGQRAELEARLWAHSPLETLAAATVLVDDRGSP